jgi:hypothetical protein
MKDVHEWTFHITTTVGSGIVGLTISGIPSGEEEMVAQALASLLREECRADEVPSWN